MNSRVVTILGGSFALTGVIAALVFWMIGNGEKAANRASSQFATALVRADAGLAPNGAADYVKGVRQVFGEVRSARVIDTRSARIGSGKRARTLHVTEVHLETAKGPAVLELEFDEPKLLNNSDKITSVYEVIPREVPDDGLSDAEFTALAKAFVERGGRPANDIELSGSIAQVPDIVSELPRRVREISKPPAPTREQRAAQRLLRCVRKADGDVGKMAACSAS